MARFKKNNRKAAMPKRRPRGKKAIVRKALAKSWKKSVAKVVKSTISKMVETKEYDVNFVMNPKIIQSSASGIGTYNTTLDNNNLRDLSPSNISTSWETYNISVGDGSNQRTGQKIRVKSAKLNLLVRATPYEQATSATGVKNTYPAPFILKLFFFKDKKYPQFGSSGNIYRDNFLQYGNVAYPFSGALVDTQMKMDPAEYQYIGSRTLKIGNQRYDSGATLLANQTLHFNNYVNNDFKLIRNISVDLTKDFGKNLIWDDGNEGVTNKHVFVLAQVCPVDENINYQNTPPTYTMRDDTERLCEVLGHLQIKYTDM